MATEYLRHRCGHMENVEEPTFEGGWGEQQRARQRWSAQQAQQRCSKCQQRLDAIQAPSDDEIPADGTTTSKYAGYCGACGFLIPAGERVVLRNQAVTTTSRGQLGQPRFRTTSRWVVYHPFNCERALGLQEVGQP